MTLVSSCYFITILECDCNFCQSYYYRSFLRTPITMWYEILPSIFLVGACLCIPRVIMYKWHGFKAGTEQNRDLRQCWDRTMFMRDIRVAGHPWRTIQRAGLETIPDL